MPFNVSFALGLQRLIDSHLAYSRTGHSVYLRIRNFPDVQGQAWAQLGFRITPTGYMVGTQDILITPQPAITPVSTHNIGQSMGKLRFGAVMFDISATFVDKLVNLGVFTGHYEVFTAAKTIGLFMGEREFSIEDIKHVEIAGKTISWLLTCNTSETLVG